MKLEQAIEKIKSNPRKLFLIDGLGAMLSAFLLGVVLVELERFFGIPRPTLYFLALFPCLFAIYDFYCYIKIDRNPGAFLLGIAFLNITYCFLSIGLAIYHYHEITSLGWIYFVIEVMIVVSLSILEINVAAKLNSEK